MVAAMSGIGSLSPAQPSRPSKRPAWMSLTLVLSTCITVLFGIGAHRWLSESWEPNLCAMTYMYEYPQYVQITLPERLSRSFPSYGLYAYSEGALAEKVIANAFSGVPVLFLPGNSGSFKQVRSLASVALRKALQSSDYELHFDFFALDFGEELSAIQGSVLRGQSEFAAECVAHILKLYSAEDGPESVVLIGHSIGGLIARSLFLQPGFHAFKVNTIITLATPHEPVVVMDEHISAFYDDVNMLWNNQSSNLKHVTVVSIGGGFRDIQVRPDLTFLRHGQLNVSTTGMLGVWVSTDHKCIVWCKQLVLAVVRALFECVHPLSKQITLDAAKRLAVFKRHFVDVPSQHLPLVAAGGAAQQRHQVMLQEKAEWLPVLSPQFIYDAPANRPEDTYLVVRIVDDPQLWEMVVEAVDMEHHDWLLACTAADPDEGRCSVGHSLTHSVQRLPSKGQRKVARVFLPGLGLAQDYTHIVVVVPKPFRSRIIIDLFNPLQRHLHVNLPFWMTFFKSEPLLREGQTSRGAAFYNFTLSGFASTWQAFTVSVEPLSGSCRPTSSSHLGLMRFFPGWTSEVAAQVLLRNNDSNRMVLKTPVPIAQSHQGSLIVYLNPECQFSITVSPSVADMMGQVVLFYAAQLPAYLASCAILTLSEQMASVAQSQTADSFLYTLATKVSPVRVIMPARLLAAILAMDWIADAWPDASDWQVLQARQMDFALLPILMFFVAMGVTVLVSASGSAQVVVVAQLVKALGGCQMPRWTWLGTLVAVMMVAVSLSFCGALALCLGLFFYLLHLIGLKARRCSSGESLCATSQHIQFSLFLLMLLSTLLNMPSLLGWMLHVPAKRRVSQDPSALPALIWGVAMPVLWKPSWRLRLRHSDWVATLLKLLGAMTLLFGCLTLYRINYFLCGCVVTTLAHQLLAPVAAPEPPEKKEK